MKENPLHLIMNPRSIATVGAGNNPLKMGTIQAVSIIKDGFKGKFMPVHPKEKTVLGFKANPSVLDLPEAPDLAMFVVPTDQVIPLLEDFGKIGTRRAVIISAGFKETGPEGEELERRLNEVAARYGIRFLGPNCIGIVNTQASLNMTVLQLKGKPGCLGLASQSGTYATQTLPYLRRRGIRFSKAISLGNEANIDIVDALEYLGEDKHTRAIALYIEGIRNGRRFLGVARKITPHKPVVAQYVGGSAAGARAGRSHTGSLAGPDYLYDGLFKQAGIIRVDTIEDLYAHAWTLATQPPLRGNRVAVLTNSGGPGTAMAHTCNSGGLEVPEFSDALKEQIKPHLPAQAAVGNPVDLTFHLDVETLVETIPELILKSGEVDGIVLHGAMGSAFMMEQYPHLKGLLGNPSEEEFLSLIKRDFSKSAALPRRYNMPMIVSSFFDHADDAVAAYQALEVPVFDSPEKAARAMLSLRKRWLIKERRQIEPPRLPAPSAEASSLLLTAMLKGEQALDEYRSKRLLAAYGIPLSEERLVDHPDQAVLAAAEIGYPVALKGCSSEFLHKTERGLVHLGLRNADELRRAFELIQQAAGKEIQILVSRMVPGGRELMAGITRFPAFGPCVLFGLGGIFTEILRDITFRVAPLSKIEAEEMLDDFRAYKILGETRGLPAVDREALTVLLQNLSFIPLLHPEVAEIDLNPIVISGSRPVVVDALVILMSRKDNE